MNIFRAFIILKEYFDKLKNILLFKEKEEFLSTKNNIELYKNKKNSIISQLISKNDTPNVKEFVKNIKIFNNDINDKDKITLDQNNGSPFISRSKT